MHWWSTNFRNKVKVESLTKLLQSNYFLQFIAALILILTIILTNISISSEVSNYKWLRNQFPSSFITNKNYIIKLIYS